MFESEHTTLIFIRKTNMPYVDNMLDFFVVVVVMPFVDVMVVMAYVVDKKKLNKDWPCDIAN